MTVQKQEETWMPFPDAEEDVTCDREAVQTDQTAGDAWRLAFYDEAFLVREELRPMRLALEFMKPELILQEKNIQSTVVFFGSARIPAPAATITAENETQRKNLEAASFYYQQAMEFARLCSLYSKTTNYQEFVVMTGGGPGIMEAGNRGATEVGAPNIGLNIILPYEQAPNPYITPELCFKFHYFAMRKMHFLIRAKAIVVFPGGFGTLDELFEALTLIRTQRMAPIPVLLFGTAFWKNVVNFDFMIEQGVISSNDSEQISFVDTIQEGWEKIRSFYDL